MRLFVGLEIDAAVRAGAVEACVALRTSGAPLRFETPEKMHVTIAFLGKTSPEQLAPVDEALNEAASGIAPFTLAFDRIGAFPNERRPRVIWLGTSVPSASFEACAHTVRGSLNRLGWTFDSDAVAHVTLCRAKPPLRGMPPLELPVPPPTLAVDHLALFESLPAGPTTRYIVRKRLKLCGTRGMPDFSPVERSE